MTAIAITPERLENERHEAAAVCALLDAGWHRVHLRHPGASRTDVRKLIEAIPQAFHSCLVLHGHFDLCNDFNLGGLHLNHRCPDAPALYRGALSRSCHSIDELRKCTGLAYATLSPILTASPNKAITQHSPARPSPLLTISRLRSSHSEALLLNEFHISNVITSMASPCLEPFRGTARQQL